MLLRNPIYRPQKCTDFLHRYHRKDDPFHAEPILFGYLFLIVVVTELASVRALPLHQRLQGLLQRPERPYQRPLPHDQSPAPARRGGRGLPGLADRRSHVPAYLRVGGDRFCARLRHQADIVIVAVRK